MRPIDELRARLERLCGFEVDSIGYVHAFLPPAPREGETRIELRPAQAQRVVELLELLQRNRHEDITGDLFGGGRR
jgi:hypothetical protein